jgi:hypothetical protein
MEAQQTTIEISERSQEIADQVRNHMNERVYLGEKAKPFLLDEYSRFVGEFLGLKEPPISNDDVKRRREPISDDDIKRELDRVSATVNFRDLFRENHRYCVSVIPCNRFGDFLEEKQIDMGMHVVTLEIDESGRTVGGYTGDASYIYDLQPVEVQNTCTFSVGTYAPLGPDENKPYDVTEGDRVRVIAEYARVLKNAQSLFRQKQQNLDVN